ncbi:MAG: hypothetical protein GWN93_06080 [Deltaproteobacteria bacterium]|nr:hypothetical protein [Deltaproteobacteria bacterium]
MAGITVRKALAKKGLVLSEQATPASGELVKRGTQVLYVPTHAYGNLMHPDVEAGFITSLSVKFAFCRFWYKDRATVRARDLRTKLNSEATSFDDLYVVDTVGQELVDEALKTYC